MELKRKSFGIPSKQGNPTGAFERAKESFENFKRWGKTTALIAAALLPLTFGPIVHAERKLPPDVPLSQGYFYGKKGVFNYENAKGYAEFRAPYYSVFVRAIPLNNGEMKMLKRPGIYIDPNFEDPAWASKVRLGWFEGWVYLGHNSIIGDYIHFVSEGRNSEIFFLNFNASHNQEIGRNFDMMYEKVPREGTWVKMRVKKTEDFTYAGKYAWVYKDGKYMVMAALNELDGINIILYERDRDLEKGGYDVKAKKVLATVVIYPGFDPSNPPKISVKNGVVSYYDKGKRLVDFRYLGGTKAELVVHPLGGAQGEPVKFLVDHIYSEEEGQ